MRILPALFAFASLAAAAHGTTTVTASAIDSVGVSFQGDIAAANSNPGVSSNPTLKAAVTAGDDLLTGNRVLVGTFTTPDSDLQAHGTDVGYLLSHFTLYGSTQIGQVAGSGGGANGTFSTELTLNPTPSNLANKQIYFFILGSTDNSTLSQSFSTAFQVGVYYLDTFATGNTEWRFKADTDIPSSSLPDLADLTVGGNGQSLVTNGTAHVVLGSFGADQSISLSGKNFSLVAVPEPGTAALALVGGIAVLLRRRQRR
jgi:hypothetical protein